MKIKLDLLGSAISAEPDSPERSERETHLAERERSLDEKRAVGREGWGAHRAHRKNKRTTWERI